MNSLLDANAWIGHLRQTTPMVTQRLSQHPASDVALCSMVLAELLDGAQRSHPSYRAANFALVAGLRQQYVSLPFDDPPAEEYGRIRSLLANQGTPIGPNDLIIAAIALANKLTLITHNTDQIRFLRSVQEVFQKNKKLVEADLYEPPLTVFGRNAVERFFTPEEIRELLELTNMPAA